MKSKGWIEGCRRVRPGRSGLEEGRQPRKKERSELEGRRQADLEQGEK